MKITINDMEVAITEVSYNDGLGYGKFHSDNIVVYPYEFHLTKEEFIRKLSETYNETMVEMKKDDIQCKETSPFSEMNYASIEESFSFPSQLADAIDTFLYRDIFDKTLGSYNNNRYIINSTESVNVRENYIVVKGRCFEYKTSNE